VGIRDREEISNPRPIPSKEAFADARRDVSEAYTLPPECYTSSKFFELEVEKIFLKEWLCVGRIDQIPNPGDYFSLVLLGEPLVVTRDESREVRVLSRTCRHRAMMVVEGEGNRRNFECPYHLWTYSLQGELLGAPLMGKSKDFDKRKCSLHSFRVDTWEGFIFVNFDANAKLLSPQLTGLSELLKNYKMGEMKSVKTLVFDDCKWNWKMMVENFMENYHVQGLHRETVNPVLPARNDITEDLDGPYAVVHLSADKQLDVSISGDQGFSGTPPFPVIKDLTLEERKKILLLLAYPTHLFLGMSDSMLYYQVFPTAADRITLRITLCVPPYTVEQDDFEENLKAAVEGIITFNKEDMWVCEGAQKGWESRLPQAGRLCYLEKVIWQINRYVINAVQNGAAS
jgi:phenylpropionate dioxygenase-like ring-hydroxylating dioxygenase large terminal subunit